MRPGCSWSRRGLDRAADGGAAAVPNPAAPILPAVSVIHRARRCAAARLLRDAGRQSPAGVTALLLVFAVAATPNFLAAVRTPGGHGLSVRSPTSSAAMRRRADFPDPGQLCGVEARTDPTLDGVNPPPYAKLPRLAVLGRCSETGYGTTTLRWGVGRQMPAVPPHGWTVSGRDRTLPDHQRGETRFGRDRSWAGRWPIGLPSRFGFQIVERWQFSFAQVTKVLGESGRHRSSGPMAVPALAAVPDRRAWANPASSSTAGWIFGSVIGDGVSPSVIPSCVYSPV